MDSVRYLNKQVNSNELALYQSWWEEQTRIYGTQVMYFPSGVTLSGIDVPYGEEPDATYEEGQEVVILANVTNDSIMLSKFGITANADMVAYIPISLFTTTFGVSSEPKAGDLIQLTEYGLDRPNGRNGPIYEITERDDEYLFEVNPLAGHYVWYIKCKRFEYSFEPGITPENLSGQVSDDTFTGRLSGGTNPATQDNSFFGNIDGVAKSDFNYSQNGDNDHVYGDY